MIGQEPRAHVRCGPWLLTARGGHTWTPGRRAGAPKAGCWPPEEAERLTHGRKRPAGLARHAIATEAARLCNCCGRHSYEVALERAGLGGPWQCEKHRGRVPCQIDGCGKTFALQEGESPDVQVVCGKHWRQSPRFMRDAVARRRKKNDVAARKRAKRQGVPAVAWTLEEAWAHHRLWQRALRAIRTGQNIDMREIERMMGWD